MKDFFLVLLQNCSSLDLVVDVDVDVETLTILFAFRQFRLCFFRFLAFFIRNLVLRDFSNEPKESERDAAAGGGGGEEMVYAGGRVFYGLLVCKNNNDGGGIGGIISITNNDIDNDRAVNGGGTSG